MSLYQKLKRLYTHAQVLGTYWPDYRDAWIVPVRTDGRPDRVLDAGCGQGEILAEFRRFDVPVDYHGVDLGVGERDWKFQVSAIADLHRLPYKNGSFDKIICNQVLEHVDRPDDVLGELVRVLSPGGRLFLSVPFVWHLHQEPYDRFRFSLHALQYLLGKHALTVDLIQPMGGYFSVLRYVLSSHTLVTANLSRPWNVLAGFFSRLYKYFDVVIVAPTCFCLDHLDRGKKLTLGYFVHLSSVGPINSEIPDDPHCCPRCFIDEPNKLVQGPDNWTCSRCRTIFPVLEGVPILTLPEAYPHVSDSLRSVRV